MAGKKPISRRGVLALIGGAGGAGAIGVAMRGKPFYPDPIAPGSAVIRTRGQNRSGSEMGSIRLCSWAKC